MSANQNSHDPALLEILKEHMRRCGQEGEPTPELLALLETAPGERLLDDLALGRESLNDPAPPPTALALLGGDALAAIEPLWPRIQGFAAAQRYVPRGEERKDKVWFAYCWLLISRGCALLVTGPDPSAIPLTAEERIHAAVASVALAAAAVPHDVSGFLSVMHAPKRLLALSEGKDLPSGIHHAAHSVARGLLHAGAREEERELLRLLTAHEFGPTESVSAAPSPTSVAASTADTKTTREKPVSAATSPPSEEGAGEFREALSRKEAALALGISMKSLDRRIADGSLEASQVGGRVLITRTAINKLLNGPKLS